MTAAATARLDRRAKTYRVSSSLDRVSAGCLTALGLSLLAGCATVQDLGPSSPHFRYPEGTRLSLNQAVEIQPGEASVRLQFGRIVPRNGVQEQEPHCIFEIDTVRDTVQRIEPDVFTVTRVDRGVWMSAFPVAAALRVGLGDHSGPTLIYYQTEFRLRSARQPGVRSLLCQSNQNAAGIHPNMRHLTLEEIRQALGAIFTIHLPDQRVEADLKAAQSKA